jgi:hypothetical protein
MSRPRRSRYHRGKDDSGSCGGDERAGAEPAEPDTMPWSPREVARDDFSGDSTG